MTKRMLIDSTHAEETRVVVLDGNRLEDFDVETSTKKQLKGNIYLAKIVRVEPSLQAAFVEYGNGRHGFLAFGEIHPDYYQIPVADRKRLLEMQAAEARDEDDDEDEPKPARRQPREHAPRPSPEAEFAESESIATPIEEPPAPEPTGLDTPVDEPVAHEPIGEPAAEIVPEHEPETPPPAGDDIPENEPPTRAQPALIANEVKFGELEFGAFEPESSATEEEASDESADLPAPETIGGESDVFEGNGAEEARARRSSRMLRSYRIQEVIRRRQIMLIQVVKEERGTKGAALTTYISLAGRFCVLMPNSPRGGGISRKITSSADRRRLKEITAELEIPQGMGLIVRTAGAARPKPEIKRDCEYLMRLWDDIRDHTMRSTAPALIYEEASLIKRSIRDGYSRDIEEVLVDGEDGWRAAHDFMRMLMPAHAKKVILWQKGGQPLFSANGVEAQLEAMLSPNVQLKSGGYLVINQTEALVAIDVNSGRATRERGIEETALKTNLEAVDEIARQLRLRDLAGLIVLDLIDMEAKKHNLMVERRLKDALKNDRARIQVGFISHFGLLEMSRQRLRPSLTETSFMPCPHCVGTGLVRSIESSAINVLRAIEDEGAKDKAALIMVHAANAVIMYILNNKRERLGAIEARYAFQVHFSADESLVPPEIRIDRLKPQVPEAERVIAAPVAPAAPSFAEDEDVEDTYFPPASDDDEEESPVVARPDPRREPRERGPETAASIEEGQRRRRRRRRGGRREGGEEAPMADGVTVDDATDGVMAQPEPTEDGANETAIAAPMPEAAPAAEDAPTDPAPTDPARAEQPGLDAAELDENGQPKARRRGRRGGRRRRRDGSDPAAEGAAPSDQAEARATDPGDDEAPFPQSSQISQHVAAPFYVPQPYDGPTPANPFGGSQTYDIFDMIDRAAEESEARGPRVEMDIPPVPPAAVAPKPVVLKPVVPKPVAVAEPEPVAVEPVVVEPVVVEPVVVEPETPPAEPKRGWWRKG